MKSSSRLATTSGVRYDPAVMPAPAAAPAAAPPPVPSSVVLRIRPMTTEDAEPLALFTFPTTKPMSMTTCCWIVSRLRSRSAQRWSNELTSMNCSNLEAGAARPPAPWKSAAYPPGNGPARGGNRDPRDLDLGRPPPRPMPFAVLIRTFFTRAITNPDAVPLDSSTLRTTKPSSITAWTWSGSKLLSTSTLRSSRLLTRTNSSARRRTVSALGYCSRSAADMLRNFFKRDMAMVDVLPRSGST
mmetsp:Transcript_3800/g.8959  ORF Transcript_3800/g.8959 Transcript_3800/m.8959 type:complete len:243 (+) Transcript_3800:349-1077(+)